MADRRMRPNVTHHEVKLGTYNDGEADYTLNISRASVHDVHATQVITKDLTNSLAEILQTNPSQDALDAHLHPDHIATTVSIDVDNDGVKDFTIIADQRGVTEVNPDQRENLRFTPLDAAGKPLPERAVNVGLSQSELPETVARAFADGNVTASEAEEIKQQALAVKQQIEEGKQR